MHFKVVPFQGGSQRDNAVLTGIANGLTEFYAVPEHPPGVSKLMRRHTSPQNAEQQSIGGGSTSRKVVHKA